MRFFVARHGETEWNVLNKVCGRTEVDLTEKDGSRRKCWLINWLIKR